MPAVWPIWYQSRLPLEVESTTVPHSPYRQLGSSTDTRSVIVSMATDHINETIMDHGTSFQNLIFSCQCRWGVARQWAAVVIQRAVRHWLARCRARRVRRVRVRVRNRAASLIQHHWQLYIQEKRRYEATYTKLKAKLEQ